MLSTLRSAPCARRNIFRHRLSVIGAEDRLAGASRPPRRTVLGAVIAATLLSPCGSWAQAPPGADAVEEVVVTSSRVATPLRQVGTAVSVVDAEEIQLRAYHSVADVLRTQPGIGVSNTGGAGKSTSLRIRGEEGYRTLVMIDGIDISDPTGTQVGPSFDHLLTTTDIERVEILRGPQGFVYGADAGGVVNILTRTGGDEPSGQIGIELGDFHTRKAEASLSGGGDAADYYFSVTDLESDGFNSQVADTLLADDDGYENTTFHGKVGWTPVDDFRLQLVARDIDAVSEFDRCGLPATADCIALTEQTTYRLSADYGVGDFTHLIAYSSTDVERDNLAAGAISFATQGELGSFEYTGSWRPSAPTTLVYGVDLEEENVLASDGSELDQSRTGYYFEYQRSIDERFFITAGARLDDNDDFGEHTSVRATVAYVTEVGGGTIKYRASYGTGFRAPSPSELAYNAGPNAFPPAAGLALSEESSGGYDIGVELAAASGLRLEATWFDQRIEDEIYFDLSGFSGYLQSLGTSRSKGVELGADVPIGMRWELFANLTFNDTEDADGEQRRRRPEKLANVGARFSSMGDRFRVVTNYRLSRDAVDEIFGIGMVPLEDYAVLDASGAYTLGERLEVYARWQNVTDEDYQEVTGFNTAKSSLSAGVRLRF